MVGEMSGGTNVVVAQMSPFQLQVAQMSTLLKVAQMSGGTVALMSGGTYNSGTKVAASKKVLTGVSQHVATLD